MAVRALVFIELELVRVVFVKKEIIFISPLLMEEIIYATMSDDRTRVWDYV